MKSLILIALVLPLTVATAQSDSTASSAVGRVSLEMIIPKQDFAAAGLHKLSEAEQQALVALIQRAAKPSRLHQVAYSRMLDEGWESVPVFGTVERSGTTYLVYQGTHSGHYGVELPLMATFTRGVYWAKRGLPNRLDAIIDQAGMEHDLMLAEVVDLK